MNASSLGKGFVVPTDEMPPGEHLRWLLALSWKWAFCSRMGSFRPGEGPEAGLAGQGVDT